MREIKAANEPTLIKYQREQNLTHYKCLLVISIL